MSNEHHKRDSWEHFLLRAARDISLSARQYQTIDDRYSQLQKILAAADDPLLTGAHIFVQGSIRLKTTIKPIDNAPEDLDTIDADAIVWLPNAAGAEASRVLEAIMTRFQEGSRVHAEIKPLRRGIRIVYADQNPGFHIDVTPARAIDGNDENKGQGMLEVPDRETGWKASSPIPYSDWLDTASTKKIALNSYAALTKGQTVLDEASQDPLPDYQEYLDQDPLRATIKLLKRHRDEWAIRTNNAKNRPISAVITTLATHAYLKVVEESASNPLRPLDAILAIVSKMPTYIEYIGRNYRICNPEDDGENFAEKWNRPLEGQHYYQAFRDWHSNACEAVAVGLASYSSAEFEKAVKENFGISSSFISTINNEIPPNWTMPGRPEGTTRNAASLGALIGGTTSSSKSQASIKPVERLG